MSRYDVIYPDGRTETILSVPSYDFEWQTDYMFKRPLELPKGTRLHATAWYDNSPANKSNPDATKTVWWGDQTPLCGIPCGRLPSSCILRTHAGRGSGWASGWGAWVRSYRISWPRRRASILSRSPISINPR